MTKITTYNRGIIIDGHADTKEECETITLLCNSLAKDENFKQVAYDDGYAAFEKVGKAERLRFAPPLGGETWMLNTSIGSINSVDVNIPFTSNNTSFSRFHFLGSHESNYYYLYYDTTLVYDTDDYGTYTNEAYRTIIFATSPTGDLLAWLQANATKQSSKLSVDLTTLSGWANLSSGSHTIKIVAKGTGYRDSEKSAGVEVTKATEVYNDCLTFTGKTSEFTLKATSKGWDGTLQWSTDHNTWTTLAGTEAMQSVGKKLYLRGKGNTTFQGNDGVTWQLSAQADCSGNIQTLLDWENPPTSITKTSCYSYMFDGCTNLTNTPELSATTLAAYCYNHMFDGCTGLTNAPELPATTLSNSCYNSMFNGCANLTTAPELPAATLKDFCYYRMFFGCSKLKVSTSSGNKIFKCPSNIPNQAVSDMFINTGGSFTGTPTAGNTYYWTE